MVHISAKKKSDRYGDTSLNHYLYFSGILQYLNPTTIGQCMKIRLDKSYAKRLKENCLRRVEGEDYKKYEPKKVGYLKDIGLYHYRNHLKDIFIRGDVYNPEYWLLCKSVPLGVKPMSNNSCERKIFLFGSHQVSAEYKIRRNSLLVHYADVEKRLEDRIKSFVVVN